MSRLNCRPYCTIGVAGLLAVLGLALAGCGGAATSSAQTSAEDGSGAPQKLTLLTVALEPWPRAARVQGSLQADERAVVGAEVAGRVQDVPVDVGTPVGPNDPLVRLHTEELDMRVRQAQSQLDQALTRLGLDCSDDETRIDRDEVPSVVQAKAVLDEAQGNLDRAVGLLEQRVISVEEIQQRQAARKVAAARHRAALYEAEEWIAEASGRRAELDMARHALEDAVVRSPFAGVVQERHVAPGTYVQVGQPVATLVRIDPLRFRGGVPEREAGKVAVGQEVAIHVEGRPGPLPAKVARISPALEAAGRALWVEADVPNPGGQLRAGLFAEADIVVDPAARALAVPAAAVSEFAGVEKVWRVREGAAREVVVQTGRRDGQRVEVLSGLAVGDVIAADASQARPGPVAVEPGPVAAPAGAERGPAAP